MKRWVGSILATAIHVVSGILMAAPAHASRDSGIQSYGCAGKYGQLRIYQSGSGNSWAPGDWAPGYSQWNPSTNYYRWITDRQNVGSGGGAWRVVTNGDYSQAIPECTQFG